MQLISCRRVRFQTIDANDNPVGDATYGVLVSTDHCGGYNDTFDTLEQLNAAIALQGMPALVENYACDFDVNSKEPRFCGENYIGPIRP